MSMKQNIIYLISKQNLIIFILIIVLVALYMKCTVAYAEAPISEVVALVESPTPAALPPAPQLIAVVGALLPGSIVPSFHYLGGDCPVTDVYFNFIDLNRIIVTLLPEATNGAVIENWWAYLGENLIGPVIRTPGPLDPISLSYCPSSDSVSIEIGEHIAILYDTFGHITYGGYPDTV